jgi:predicted XRE-type DNA-binding protein
LYQKIESVLGISRDKVTEVLRTKIKEYAGR